MNKKLLLLLFCILSVVAYGKSIDLGKDVIYSETGFETNVKSSITTSTLVTSKDIEEKKYQNLEEVLRSIPAINVISGVDSQIIDIRGQGEKAKANVQILVDGVGLNSLDASHRTTPISTVPVNDIERIEVIHGAGAVLYGSGTSGGVINIITKKHKPESSISAGASYRLDTYKGQQYGVNASGSFGNGITLGAGYEGQRKSGYRKGSQDNSDYITAKLDVPFYNNKQNFSFKSSYYNSKLKFPTYLNEKQIKEYRRQSGLKPNDKNDINIKSQQNLLKYTNKSFDNINFDITAYNQHVKQDLLGNTSVGEFSSIKNGTDSKIKYTYSNDSNLIFGLGYLNDKMIRTFNASMGPMKMSSDIKGSKKTLNAFLFNTYKYENLEFVQGVRYENAKYNIDRTSIVAMGAMPPSHGTPPGHGAPSHGGASHGTPPMSKPPIHDKMVTETKENNYALNLGINYLYSDTGKTYIKYERGFTSPSPAWLTDKSPTTGYVLNNLKTEKSNTFELGFSDFIFDSTINGSIYYSNTTDEIDIEVKGMGPDMTIKGHNIGKTRRYGLDLQAQKNFDKFSITQSYSYVNAKILKDRDKGVEGKFITNVPKHKLTLGLDYKPTEELKLGIDFNYYSNYYIDKKNKLKEDGSISNVNLRANYDVNENIAVFAGLNNLLNSEYNNGVSYTRDNISKMPPKYGPVYKVYNPAPKMNGYIGFKIKM